MSDFSTSHLREHAIREMELVQVPDAVQSLVLRALKLLHDSGLNEADAFNALSAISHLYGFLPFAPLEDKDDDWIKVEEKEVPFSFIHRRCPRVFKTPDGRFVDIMKIAVKNETDVFFDERSAQYVDMPYTPSTEFIEDAAES